MIEHQPDLESDQAIVEVSEAPSAERATASDLERLEARLQALELTTRELPKRDSTGKRIRDWTGYALGLLGAMLGILGYLKSQEAASITQRIKVEQYLAEAWDLMGGEPGTIAIADFALRSQLELARRLIEKALVLEPKSTKAHRYQGVYFQAQGKPDEAIHNFRTAMHLDPDDAAAPNNLGNILYTQKNYREAIEAYRTAIRLGPKFAPAHFNLGNALHTWSTDDEAIEAYRNAVRLEPGQAIFHNSLGLALKIHGRFDEAIKELHTASRLDPDEPIFRSNLGLALHGQGIHDEAIKELRAAIQLGPGEAVFQSNLGFALYAQGKIDEAIKELRAAIRLDPDYGPAHYYERKALEVRDEKDGGTKVELAAILDDNLPQPLYIGTQ